MSVMWHGGEKWLTPPEIRPAKKGRAEWGPGIYGTSNLDGALKYATGNKVIQLVEFQPKKFLQQVDFGMELVTDFVRSSVKKSVRVELLAALERSALRCPPDLSKSKIGSGIPVSGNALLCLYVNLDLSSGAAGPALSNFFSMHGVDAFTDTAPGSSDLWTVIFNPSIITNHLVLKAADIKPSEFHLPDPRESLSLKAAEFLNREDSHHHTDHQSAILKI
ncbi:TPA: hypothetical protein RQN23_004408 [Aeromonas veronii]|nr:hypothetical protein [Aeromonas veronii]